MNSERQIGVIRPEEVAHKLAAIRNLEYPELLIQIEERPRLVEMLWFLQYESMQPGGLKRFCREIIEAMPQRFTPACIRTADAGPISYEIKLRAFGEIPSRYLPETEAVCGINISELVSIALTELTDGERRTMPEDHAALEKYFKPWTRDKLAEICRRAAIDQLPLHLGALCAEIDKSFVSEKKDQWGLECDKTWYLDDPIGAVIEMMDRRAVEVSKRIAMTAVTKKVFDALDYATQERAMVRVEGDSRFGKTESVKCWCGMRPGRARLVSVPSSNSLADLHQRIAEALGIDASFGSRSQRIKSRIEYVLKHSGMFLILDESQFLLPQNYTATTAPARLNWVRTEIVDRGLPLALIVTPQTFQPMVNRFVKKTGYAMQQFFGRNARTVCLPDVLDHKDMVAVARIHFPEMGVDYLELIADLASVSENYLQAVEAIAKLARYFSRRDGHRKITVSDIEAAASEIIPQRATAPMAVHKADLKGDAKPQKRGLKPALAPSNLQPCSLRGGGRVQVKVDPILAAT
jgi:AAA domain